MSEESKKDLKEKIMVKMTGLNLWTLATINEEGKPWVRYVTPTRSDEDLTIWMATSIGSRKAGQIRKNPEVHMTEIAKILGVTRGAVQQTVDRLMKKGLVEKYMDESDKKKVYLSLTPKGRTAFNGHETYHAELSSYLGEHFNRLRPKEVDSMREFFTKVESFMDVYNEQKLQRKSQAK